MRLPVWSQAALPTRLATELQQPPDREWGRMLAPELSYGRHAGPARGDARRAAVAVVLCWDGDEWSLPLTIRSPALTRHGGQISLPGGLLDNDETPRTAAGRELEEELGVRPELTWLGELAPLFVYASNTVVTPCVAAIDHWPSWEANPAEVGEILRLRLRELLSSDSPPPLEIDRGPLRFSAPQFRVDGHSAWGATAVMLGELRGRLRRLSELGMRRG